MDPLVVLSLAGLALEFTQKGTHVLPEQSDIEALDLAGTQTTGPKGAAYLLRAKYGKAIVFTSGHRDLNAQLHAMAVDIVKSGNRQWIHATYKKGSDGRLLSSAHQALQDWVTAHPDATTVDAIYNGFRSVVAKLTSAQIGSISRHMLDPSQAFDIEPLSGSTGAKVEAELKSLPGEFLDHEGGLSRWHFQCDPNVAMPADSEETLS